jgi:hypothetical protein
MKKLQIELICGHFGRESGRWHIGCSLQGKAISSASAA